MAKFSYKHLLFVITAILFIYYLVENYDTSSVTYSMKHYLPSEETKDMDFKKFNEIPSTLEEDVVSKMSPIIKDNYMGSLLSSSEGSYKPILNPLHDASPINE